MRFRIALLSVMAVLLCAAVKPARAQIAAYGEFTGVNTGLANTPHLYGGTFGVYMTRRLGPVAFGPDFRGVITSHGASGSTPDQVMDAGLGGLRLAVTPHVLPIMPYLEVLGGMGYQRTGQGVSRQDKFSGMAQFLAGVDYTILPRLDWRVVEFSYGRLGGSIGVFNPKTLSTGIVLRLP